MNVSFHDHVGMLPVKHLRDVTVPTNRQTTHHRFIHSGERNPIPFDRDAFGIQQRRFVIDHLDWLKRPFAESAGLCAIPLLEHAAHQTLFRRDIQLQQTVLSTILLDRPTRAVLKLQIGLAD